jgi:hypothetical protein
MEVLIPLKEKSLSFDVFDNVLLKDKNIYVMDNHRLALWCWLNEIKLNQAYNLMHIDAHPDMSQSAVEEVRESKVQIEKLTLLEYRNLKQEKFNVPLIRWDNYIPIFTNHFSKNFIKETSISFTHKLGSDEKLANDFSAIFLIREMNDLFSGKRFVNNSKWIVNLDIDYFFASQPTKEILFNEVVIKKIGALLKMGLENDIIQVLTIALSPECSGSWENAIYVFNLINSELKSSIKI